MVKVKGLVARPVPMRVTNEDVPSIRDVDPIGEVGDALTPVRNIIVLKTK